ncbi:MAG: hypothetical protein Q9166_008126 [cf. Caloplaca sp. 2 TL-2023]
MGRVMKPWTQSWPEEERLGTPIPSSKTSRWQAQGSVPAIAVGAVICLTASMITVPRTVLATASAAVQQRNMTSMPYPLMDPNVPISYPGQYSGTANVLYGLSTLILTGFLGLAATVVYAPKQFNIIMNKLAPQLPSEKIVEVDKVVERIKPVNCTCQDKGRAVPESAEAASQGYIGDKHPPSTFDECIKMYEEKRAHELNDSELVEMTIRGVIPFHALEKTLADFTRAVRVRRAAVSRTPGIHRTNTLEGSLLPFEDYDFARVFGSCAENVIGYMPIPVGVAGPIIIDGTSVFLPMSTTEGALIASTSRGAKALNGGGGVTTVITGNGMTRAPVVKFSNVRRAGAAKDFVDSPEGQEAVKKAFDSTSRFGRLQRVTTKLAGSQLYLRFKATTGDAMGMNMISKGVQEALTVLTRDCGFPDMEIVSLSGNFCTDKKPAPINWIDGRGKGIVAECVVPKEVVERTLKCTVDGLCKLNVSKNLVGSALAGSVGGNNAHAANIVTAIFLATGQDPAQTVGSSNCMTLMEPTEHGDLRISVSMPSIEVGTVGGGTVLEPQGAMLDLIGVRGSNDGQNAMMLAKVVAAGVLAGELSLCSALTLIGYGLLNAFQNSYNHALSKFPGPPTASFSNLSYCRRFLGGRQPYDMLQEHNKYGPVVRTAPNELSFNTFEAWRDIYGFRNGHDTFIKSNFYDGGSFAAQAHSIVSERDPTEHGKMRKYLSHAFSDRSLKEQENLVAEVVDQFIEQIGKEGGSTGQGINLVTWFNLTTFDIITSLAFGEAFGGVQTGKTHFWIAIVISSLGQGALADVFNRFPFMRTLFKAITPSSAYEDTKKHESYTIDLVTKRINRKTDRKDFMTRILENRDKSEISDIQLAAHASDFVVAGSETTATALSAINYYLIRTPHARKQLQDEIRNAFKSYDEINATSTAPLKYMEAVCKEAMRMYVPLPLGLPRVVPEGGDTVNGDWLPGGTVVSVNPMAASLSESNFHEPFAFKPERWIGENYRDKLDASQPFSMGARGCLGRSLAWMELRTILAKMHFKYDFKLLNEDLDWNRDSEMHTLWNKPNLMVHVLPRAEAETASA